MKTKLKKFTFDDMQYIKEALKAFCTTRSKTKNVTLHHPELGDQYLGNGISLPEIEYFKKAGFDVDYDEGVGYNKKDLIIADFPVDIISLEPGTGDYSKRGLRVEVRCYGETTRRLRVDMDRKQEKVLEYATSYGIPLSRICIGEESYCERSLCRSKARAKA